jgi:ATP-dependent Lon protease
MQDYVKINDLEELRKRVLDLDSKMQKLMKKSDPIVILEMLKSLSEKYLKDEDIEKNLNRLALQYYLLQHKDFLDRLARLLLRTILERKLRSVDDARKFIKILFEDSIRYYRKREEYSSWIAWLITKQRFFNTDSIFLKIYSDLNLIINELMGPSFLTSEEIFDLTSKLLINTKKELEIINRTLEGTISQLETLEKYYTINAKDVYKKIDETKQYVSNLQNSINQLRSGDPKSLIELLYLRFRLIKRLRDLANMLDSKEFKDKISESISKILDEASKMLAENYKFLDLMQQNSKHKTKPDELFYRNFCEVFKKRLKDLGIDSKERFYLYFRDLKPLLNRHLDTLTLEEVYEPLFIEFLCLEKPWINSLLEVKF